MNAGLPFVFDVEPALVAGGTWAYGTQHGMVRIANGASATQR